MGHLDRLVLLGAEDATLDNEATRMTTQVDSPEVKARIQEGLPIVKYLSHQMRRQFAVRMLPEELASYGHEGLLSAARSYDPSKGIQFRSWANLRVRGAIIDGLRSQGQLPRRMYQKLRALEASDRVQEAQMEETAATPPKDADAADARLSSNLQNMAMAMAASFLSGQRVDAEVVGDNTPGADEVVAREELLRVVREAIARRPDTERILLERYYFEDIAFDQTARELGLSKSWASRLHSRAIEAVADDLKKRKYDYAP